MWHHCPKLAEARTDELLAKAVVLEALPPTLRDYGVAPARHLRPITPFWGGEPHGQVNEEIGAAAYASAAQE
eukprot:14743887-Alexandrium_andersonii.AAC.1